MESNRRPGAGPEAVDLREIGGAIRRNAIWIIGGASLGLILALAITFSLPPQYQAASTVLVRSGEQAPSALARVGALVGGLPGGVRSSDLDTELQLLTSRALIGEVVDSLELQSQILEPEKMSPHSIFAGAEYAPVLTSAVYEFRRRGGSYEVSGPGASGLAVPGVPYHLPGAVLTMRRSGLPETFTAEIVGREDAIDRVQTNLTAANPGGDVVQLAFRARDPQMAAAVPNALVAHYLRRRRTSDRGVNQRRFEFLTNQADSIAAELAMAEVSLRRQQEGSGIIDPEAVGRADLERVMSLRAELEAIEVEARALEQIITQSTSGEISARQLAAYPTFLRNGAINSLLSRLLELETRRVELLERRTDRDPDVVAVTKTIDALEDQLVALSQSYRSGLLRQREALRRELGQYRQEVASLPGQAQENTRRRRDVARLSETLLALQAQMVEARLAAISEGGDVRQIDRAVVPRKPSFPNPLLNSAGGLLAGLFFGVVGAVVFSQVRRRIFEPWEAELATGLPAARFDPQLPLFFPAVAAVRTVLLLPVGRTALASRVGEHIAATAALRGTDVVFADMRGTDGYHAPVGQSVANGGPAALSGLGPDSKALTPVAAANGVDYPVYRRNGRGTSALEIRETLSQLEARYSLVVAVLPELADPVSVALMIPERSTVLVAERGVARSDLQEVIALLNRMGIASAGVVIDAKAGNGGGGS